MNEKQERFKSIYEAESDNIFRFVFLRISSREEAIDITGEVFFKFWQVLLQEKEVINPRALLFTIARNKVIDWYKRKHPESLDRLIDGMEGDEGPPFQVVDEEAWRSLTLSVEAKWVLGVLDRLVPQYKEVVSMRFVAGLTLQEISEVLKISPNAVSLRLNHALQKIRQELNINIEDNE